MPNYPHTAITTWSGFVFQGYCAIHHTLSLINSTEHLESLSDYNLQLDSIEDFTVLDQDDAISLHQCKAYKDDRYSAYSEAFSKLMDKTVEYQGASFFLHTARQIVDKSLDDIHTEQAPIVLYNYGDTNHYCSVDLIEEKIVEEIKKYQEQKYPLEPHRNEIGFCRNIASKLIRLVNEKILTIHRQIHESNNQEQREIAFGQRITFQEFLTYLNGEYNSLSKEYIIWLHRKSILNYISDYFDECEIDNIPWRNVLTRFFEIIRDMGIEEFELLIKKMNPHRPISFEDFEAYDHHKPSDTDYKMALFPILYKLIDPLEDLYWDINSMQYYPSTISNTIDKKRSTCHKIINNRDIPLLFSDSANIITLHLDVDSVRNMAVPIADVSESMSQIGEGDKNMNNLIDRPRDLSLVSLDNDILESIIER